MSKTNSEYIDAKELYEDAEFLATNGVYSDDLLKSDAKETIQSFLAHKNSLTPKEIKLSDEEVENWAELIYRNRKQIAAVMHKIESGKQHGVALDAALSSSPTLVKAVSLKMTTKRAKDKKWEYVGSFMKHIKDCFSQQAKKDTYTLKIIEPSTGNNGNNSVEIHFEGKLPQYEAIKEAISSAPRKVKNNTEAYVRAVRTRNIKMKF